MGQIQSPPKFEYQKDIKIISEILYGKRKTQEVQEFLTIHDVEKYLPWDRFRRINIPTGFTHEELWKCIKFLRRPQISINFGSYSFSFQIPNFLIKQLHLIDLHMGGSLSGNDIIPKGDEIKYLHSSLIEEAIASSQIEGAATTREVAKEMILSERLPNTHGEKMILNNFYAMQFISRNKNDSLSTEKVLNLHEILTRGTLEDRIDEGRFRQRNDIKVVDSITQEVLHNPPKQDEIEGLMEEFIIFFNQNEDTIFIHPVIKGIIIHFLVGFIHPFADGNGRTARGLFYWYIIKNGYWLTEYISISRIIKNAPTQYKNAYLYSESDDNDLTYFIDYNIKCLISGLESFKDYIKLKIDEHKIIESQLLETGINMRQIKILNWLKETSRVVTIVQVSNNFLENKNTIRLDLEGLVKLGKLKKIPLNKKTFGYTSAS